jgi:hypothetical protein
LWFRRKLGLNDFDSPSQPSCFNDVNSCLRQSLPDFEQTIAGNANRISVYGRPIMRFKP